MITENMQKFIDANAKSLVVAGEHLTPELNPINTLEDMERSDRTKYRLENGAVFVITLDDKQSTAYAPIWLIE